MKPLHDSAPWPKFAVFDIEATQWVNVVCLCHMDEFGREDKDGGIRKHVFRDVESYLDWLFSPAFLGDCVWAHWGGHYDHRFVMALAHERGWTFETVQSGNLTVILTITDANRRTIRFCESARIMPDSVEEIGKSVGLPKLDADRTNIEGLSWDEVITYCLRDCEIVLRGLQSIREVLAPLGVDFAFTLASMSTRYVRRSEVLEWFRFYEPDPERKGKLRQRKDFLAADEFAYEAYFGGRTEMFKCGEFQGPLYYYDITSSYPWSMRYELPAYFKRFDPPLRSIRQSLNRYGVSAAYVEIPEGSMPIPLLPFRGGTDATASLILHDGTKADPRLIAGKIVFMEGKYNGVWTNLELSALYEHMHKVPGFVLKLKAQALYEPLAFLKPFIDTFWMLRRKAMEEKDEFRKYAFKIAMNSVSGKLAEQMVKQKILHGKAASRALREYDEHDGPMRGLGFVKATKVPGVYVLEHEAEGPFRHAAAAAYVTGRSRVRLWEALVKAQQLGAQVYYCDTDSIIVDKPVFGLDAAKKELGEWHLEHIIKYAEIYAPKVYMIETYEPDKNGKTKHYHAKGMPIERREDKGQPERIQERWLDYVAKYKGLERPKPIKEGIRGIYTDMAKGTLHPTAFKLARSVQEHDRKRQHRGSNSIPHYYQEHEKHVSRVTATGRQLRVVG